MKIFGVRNDEVRKKHRQSQVFSIRAGLTFEKINPEVLFYGTSGRDVMLFGVLPDSNNSIHSTVTDLARFLGWSTFLSLLMAM